MAGDIRASVESLAARLGPDRFARLCADLLAGAPREQFVTELCALSGHDADAVLSPSWHDYWPRTWGARGLLHVWADPDGVATAAVVGGLSDEHWRPAEMCLKVAARHEVAGTADGAAVLAGHELPRVRVQAMRALAVVGDVEHADVVRAGREDPDRDVARHAEGAWTAMAARLDLRTSPDLV